MIAPAPRHMGLDLIAGEMEQQMRTNIELQEEVDRLRARIAQLERIIESYQNSPSGTNNVVLL